MVYVHCSDENYESSGVTWYKIEHVITLLFWSAIMKGITVRHSVILQLQANKHQCPITYSVDQNNRCAYVITL